MNSDMLRTSSINGYHTSAVVDSGSNAYPVAVQGSQSNYRAYQNDSSTHHHSHLMHQTPEPHWTPHANPNPPAYSNNISHQQPWGNQMQQNPYANAMQRMNTMSLPFIPQQVIHDALALSAPVEAADELVLVQAVLAGRNRGETYKDALNSLHGKNGHSSSLWKDYYLEHKERLDAWIALCLQDAPKTTATAKKPVVLKPNLKRESSPPSTTKSLSASPSTKQREKVKKERISMTPSAPLPPRVSGRTTQNSLSAPQPVFNNRLPPPHTEVQIPPPPSRSPSPPQQIVPGGRGYRYTAEDREFFIKFISWRLKSNSSLNRADLCTLLAEKAPHHTAQSWASYWSNHHDLPDKILAAAHGEASGSEEDEDEDVSSSDEDREAPARRRSKYYESSLTSADDLRSTVSEEGADDEGDDDEDEGDVQVYDESDMGPRGAAFTEADLYITAKYVASFTDFDNASGRERWDPYHKLHPQRSAKAWGEYYRRYESSIQRLAVKIRRQKNPVNGIDSQRARPSWAKRKHEESRDEDGDGGKRSRRA